MKGFCKDSPLNLNKIFLMTIYNAAVRIFFLNQCEFQCIGSVCIDGKKRRISFRTEQMT